MTILDIHLTYTTPLPPIQPLPHPLLTLPINKLLHNNPLPLIDPFAFPAQFFELSSIEFFNSLRSINVCFFGPRDVGRCAMDLLPITLITATTPLIQIQTEYRSCGVHESELGVLQSLPKPFISIPVAPLDERVLLPPRLPLFPCPCHGWKCPYGEQVIAIFVHQQSNFPQSITGFEVFEPARIHDPGCLPRSTATTIKSHKPAIAKQRHEVVERHQPHPRTTITLKLPPHLQFNSFQAAVLALQNMQIRERFMIEAKMWGYMRRVLALVLRVGMVGEVGGGEGVQGDAEVDVCKGEAAD